jgi:hypothetical protein
MHKIEYFWGQCVATEKDNDHHYYYDTMAKIQKPQNPGIKEISGTFITKKCQDKIHNCGNGHAQNSWNTV